MWFRSFRPYINVSVVFQLIRVKFTSCRYIPNNHGVTYRDKIWCLESKDIVIILSKNRISKKSPFKAILLKIIISRFLLHIMLSHLAIKCFSRFRNRISNMWFKSQLYESLWSQESDSFYSTGVNGPRVFYVDVRSKNKKMDGQPNVYPCTTVVLCDPV